VNGIIYRKKSDINILKQILLQLERNNSINYFLERGPESHASVAATREPRRQLGAASKPAANSLNGAPANLLNSAPKKKTAKEKPAKDDSVNEPTGWKMPAMPAPLGMA
jgi:hypothetical protein